MVIGSFASLDGVDACLKRRSEAGPVVRSWVLRLSMQEMSILIPVYGGEVFEPGELESLYLITEKRPGFDESRKILKNASTTEATGKRKKSKMRQLCIR